MIMRFFRAVLPAILAGTFGLQPAHADTYTWIDASGRLNVGNVAPPEGAHVTKVVHTSAPKPSAREEAARDGARQAEMQAMGARLRQLEEELALARQRPAPPPMEYRAAALPMPPPVQYPVDFSPPPAQYAVDAAPLPGLGCDPAWMMNCGFGAGPLAYPASVIVLRTGNFHRFHHPVHGARPFAAKPPMRVSGTFHKR